MTVVAVVVARKGSKGIPGKNARLFAGLPLVAWSIRVAKKCPLVDEIIVSTDDPEIQTIAVAEGAKAPGLRPDALATDTARTIDAVNHAVMEWSADPSSVTAVVILQPTSPLRTVADVTSALQILERRNTGCGLVDAVVSVTPASKHPVKMHTVRQGLLLPFFDDDSEASKVLLRTTNRQEIPEAYAENGAVYALNWTRHLQLRNGLSSSEIAKYDGTGNHRKLGEARGSALRCGVHAEILAPYVMSAERSHDLDSEADWKAAEAEFYRIQKGTAAEANAGESAPALALSPSKASDPQAPPTILLANRAIGQDHPPLVIAEIGINHEGDFAKAVRMVRDAKAAGAECVKFQSHICGDEMTRAAGSVIPGNAKESILAIMRRCALTKEQDVELKGLVESLGMIYLSSPFSRAAADHLQAMGVCGFKIGSGECNNFPLIRHIASFRKPMILSTGMNSLESVRTSVEIMEKSGAPYALLHVTSMYPTPYSHVRLGCLEQMQSAFPRAVLGLSDHSLGNWTCFGAVSLGASILEKHFTSNKTWPGPDVPISIDPTELKDLIDGSAAVWQARGGIKEMLPEEQVTADFAFASVVTIASIKKGEEFTRSNVWCKRPGTGEVLASEFENLLGKTCLCDLDEDEMLRIEDVQGLFC